jgi:hypothetical protein
MRDSLDQLALGRHWQVLRIPMIMRIRLARLSHGPAFSNIWWLPFASSEQHAASRLIMVTSVELHSTCQPFRRPLTWFYAAILAKHSIDDRHRQ